MTRALLEILVLALFCFMWLTSIAHAQEIKYTKDGEPYIPAQVVLEIRAAIVQCGTLDEAATLCQDGNDLCCQLVALAAGS